MARVQKEEEEPEDDLAAVMHSERRALLGATLGALVGLLLWIITIATDYWVWVEAPDSVNGIYVNRTKITYLYSHMGLWKCCKTVIPHDAKGVRGDQLTTCKYYRIFPSDEEIRMDPELDRTILDYTRSEVSFCVISMFLIMMGIAFSVYTFKEQRYMFKRLAGGVHFLSAGVMLVVIEVLSNSASYEEQYLTIRHPKGCRWSHGFSFVLAWITFSVFILAGCTFIVCSRKRKGDKAPDDFSADEPQIIGRI